MPRNGQTSADRFPPLNRLLLACLLAFAAGSPAARAQAAEAVPDAGAVLKDIPPAPPLPATAPPPAMAAPALPPVTMSAGDLSNTVLVKGFRIEGPRCSRPRRSRPCCSPWWASRPRCPS
ncbi:hypothetical protein [Chitinimonas koreensis]|uniref:hypothetical protein n=1 Tax=Chitinimonas koreensis TaxID=356302 RepID=UPI0016545D55|nr:hypothetical protein [Chitinimonas koreensis]QNM98587.1 hypothetical protein H9L41_10390 [Chitinimonas koreensis]